jgi:hypothetical protein
MIVSCNLCGGENRINPGQEILFCSYCGSSLAIKKERACEHLLFPHKRNDRIAEDTFRSFLLMRRRARCNVEEIRFAYVPFVLAEKKEGEMKLIPASKETWATISYPPAGNYRFFDESLSEGETVVSASAAPKNDDRLLHLPLYRISYSAGSWKGTACIVGGSWQVYAYELPPEKPQPLNASYLVIAASLFTIFLFLGKLAPSWPGRFVLSMIAASAGYAFFTIRDRVVKRT